MDVNQFWNIIEEADKNGGGDLNKQVEEVTKKLVSLSDEDIHEFHEIFREFTQIAHETFIVHVPDVYISRNKGGKFEFAVQTQYLPHEVSVALGGRISDDSFEYFCYWLVGRGKEFYSNAIMNVIWDENIKAFTQEALMYVAVEAYEKKHPDLDTDLYEYMEMQDELLRATVDTAPEFDGGLFDMFNGDLIVADPCYIQGGKDTEWSDLVVKIENNTALHVFLVRVDGEVAGIALSPNILFKYDQARYNLEEQEPIGMIGVDSGMIMVSQVDHIKDFDDDISFDDLGSWIGSDGAAFWSNTWIGDGIYAVWKVEDEYFIDLGLLLPLEEED